MNSVSTTMIKLQSSPLCWTTSIRLLFTSRKDLKEHRCQVLVLGGGTAGCSMAAKMTRYLGKDRVIVVDPSDIHYYQPIFTLIGGGLKKLSDNVVSKRMKDVLPRDAKWIKEEVSSINPENKFVATQSGDKIQYEWLVIALGIQKDYDKIPGLLEALKIPDSQVCSNYSPKYVEKTFKALKKFEKGNALFTFPNTAVKCAGAPQKICYLAEDYLRKSGKRENATVIYNTPLAVLFSVKKYAEALWKVVNERGIKVNLQTNLTEIIPDKKQAVFEHLDQPGKKSTLPYSFLHVTPPQSAPDVIKKNSDLCDGAGYLNVNKSTLQHMKYKNIFGIGDCTNVPTSKTAAAAAAQCGILFDTITRSIEGKTLNSSGYDGYTSCPLVTGKGKCILAEFDYNLQPLETFPVNQGVERYSMYLMKAELMPQLYWNVMLRGFWNGPGIMRKILHFGMGK